ncbi:hypothetical protein ALC53_10577 [Atta colombica]|uniref:Uncharacterized protein n=1 Tax=Atta colombica TaxID=520822 RepID=A0A195B3F2_9HYME|nr:hypothetical protein ALC53_10577 [Atta colombica]
MRGRSYVSRRRRWRRRRSSTQHPTHSRFSGRLNAFGVCQAAAPSTSAVSPTAPTAPSLCPPPPSPPPPPPAAQWPHLPPPPLAPLFTKRRAASRLVSSPCRTRRASRTETVCWSVGRSRRRFLTPAPGEKAGAAGNGGDAGRDTMRDEKQRGRERDQKREDVREEDQTAAFSTKRGMRIWRPALALLNKSITDLQNIRSTAYNRLIAQFSLLTDIVNGL